MKRNLLFWATCIVGILSLGGLFLFAASPLLYSPEMAVNGTRFHLNADVLKAKEINATTDVLPMMQELLDNPSGLVLNVRLRDLESARKDLAEYVKMYRNLDNLVINLDMTQSEMDEFVKSSEAQDEIFRSLMNETETLDALKRLEIRYRNSNDPDMMVSIGYQGEALKKRIRELYTRYEKEAATQANISRKVGLDTTKSEKTASQFREIVQETESFQTSVSRQTSSSRAVAASSPKLSLAVDPETAVYGDTVTLVGLVTPVYGNRNITIHYDKTILMNIMTREGGDYHAAFTLERTAAGKHILTARSGRLTSESVILTVLPVDSVITLAAVPDTGNKTAECNGTLFTSRPVRFAPVTVTDETGHSFSATTDGTGYYAATIPLSPGDHTLVARFSSTEFPINASESDPVSVTIPDTGILSPVVSSPNSPENNFPGLAEILGTLGIVALSGLGAFLYLSRNKGMKSPEVPAPEPPEARAVREEIETILGEEDTPVIEKAQAEKVTGLLIRYRELLEEHGISHAAHAGYLELAGRVAKALNIPRYRTKTPREMADSCRNESWGGIFSRFTGIYERIRYGGSRKKPDQEALEEGMRQAEQGIGGEKN